MAIFRGLTSHLAKWRSSPRTRIFVIAFCLSSICGAIDAFEPLEDVLKGARDVVRGREASGNFVVVGIDDKTGDAFSGFGFSRKLDAQLIDTLFANGARRVFFDRTYSDPTTDAADRAFTAVLKKHEGRVFLGSASPVSPVTRKPVFLEPLPQFRPSAKIASLNGTQTPLALSAVLTTGDTFGGKLRPSLSYALANKVPESRDEYRPDWAIRASTIPTISFVDVVEGKADFKLIEGKDIVVGPTATSLGDVRTLVFQGFIPGVYLHVIGAETLARGTPSNLGWLPGFVFAAVLSFLLLRIGERRICSALVWGTAILLSFVPLVLDEALVTINILPAVLLFSIVAVRASTLRRVEYSDRTNIASGLPNFASLSGGAAVSTKTLVALKLRNLAEIRASFVVDVEAQLIAELCRRIQMSRDISIIYHGGDVLLWLTEQPMGEELTHHLEGLHRLSMASVSVGDRDVDLSLAFGVDADHERPLSSRLGSAVQCSEEAARANDVWKFYDPNRLHEAAWALSLMSRLDHAIDTGEIFVAFQPKLDLATHRIIGAEALVRWQHPSRGLIGPDQFVPAAEEHKRIERLTKFVLERAIDVASQMRALGHDFSVAVNVSTHLLQSSDLPIVVRQTLDRYRLPPSKLTLEVTETGELDGSLGRGAQMQAFAAIGVQTSVDDFGAGHATLERLRTLQSDEVKIDKQFIHDIDTITENQVIVSGTIAIARNMNMRVVAEGIETKAEMAMVRKLGVDVGQGYFIAKPVDVMTLSELLSAKRHLRAA